MSARGSFFENDADYEQAALEAAGNAASRGRCRMMAFRAVGQLEAAANACHHGAGYPTASPAAHAEHDPRAGQRGMRCSSCGSWWKGAVSFPRPERHAGRRPV